MKLLLISIVAIVLMINPATSYGQDEYIARNLEEAQEILKNLPPGTEATILMESANGTGAGVDTTSDEVALKTNTTAPTSETSGSKSAGGAFSLNAKLGSKSSIGIMLSIFGVIIALAGGALIWLGRMPHGIVAIIVGITFFCVGIFVDANPILFATLGILGVLGVVGWFVWDQIDGNKLEDSKALHGDALKVITSVIEGLPEDMRTIIKTKIALSKANSPEIRDLIREVKTGV